MTTQKKHFLFIGNEKKAFGTLLAAKAFCCKYTKNERVKYLTGSYILSFRGGIAIAVTSIIVTTDGIIVFEKNKEFLENSNDYGFVQCRQTCTKLNKK